MSVLAQQTLHFAKCGQNYRDIKEWLGRQSDDRLLQLHKLAYQKMPGTSHILIFDEQRGVHQPKLILQTVATVTKMQQHSGPLPVLLKQATEKPHDKFGFLLIRVFVTENMKTEQFALSNSFSPSETKGKQYAHSYNSCSFPFVTEANSVYRKKKANKNEKENDTNTNEVTAVDVQSMLESLPAQMSSLDRFNTMMDHFTSPLSKQKQEPVVIKSTLTGADVRHLWMSYCDTYIWLCDQKTIASQHDWLYS